MQWFYRHFIAFIIPFISLLVVEAIHRYSFVDMAAWLWRSPLEVFTNYLLFFVIFNLFYIGSQRRYLLYSTGLTIIFSVIAYVSHVKSMYRGVPLHPSDFKLLREAISVKAYLFASLDSTLLFVAAGFATVYLLIRKMKYDRPISMFESGVIVSLCIFLLVSFLFIKPDSLYGPGKISNFSYSPAKHYDRNGLTLGFLLLTREQDDQKRPIASEMEIKKLTRSLEGSNDTPAIQPNVLFVLNESFWDPTLIDSLQLDRDPIPFFRKLTETSTHGELIVPVYGGNTANTEFEVLTAMSLWYLGGSHVIPFNDRIEQPVDSMASILTRHGYRATSMHPFNMGFYNRIATYEKLGFHNYIPPEYMYNREHRGWYVSDNVLMEQVIEVVERTEEPVFIHAVTMENHGPYDGNRYKEHRVNVNGPMLVEDQRSTQDYLEGLMGADASLEYLIGELERLNEPTVVVFFGDHLPYLGQFSVYEELGFIQSKNLESYEDFMKIYTTPLLIWKNYGEEVAESVRIGANFLMPYVLKMIGIEGNALTNILQELMEDGIAVTPSPPFREREGLSSDTLDGYELLQNDALVGEQHSYVEGIVITQEDYHLGFGKMKLIGAELRDQTIAVSGEHFVPSSVVYVNGKEVETTFIDAENLLAILDGVSSSLEVKVVVIDEWEKKELESTSSIVLTP